MFKGFRRRKAEAPAAPAAPAPAPVEVVLNPIRVLDIATVASFDEACQWLTRAYSTKRTMETGDDFARFCAKVREQGWPINFQQSVTYLEKEWTFLALLIERARPEDWQTLLLTCASENRGLVQPVLDHIGVPETIALLHRLQASNALNDAQFMTLVQNMHRALPHENKESFIRAVFSTPQAQKVLLSPEYADAFSRYQKSISRCVIDDAEVLAIRARMDGLVDEFVKKVQERNARDEAHGRLRDAIWLELCKDIHATFAFIMRGQAEENPYWGILVQSHFYQNCYWHLGEERTLETRTEQEAKNLAKFRLLVGGVLMEADAQERFDELVYQTLDPVKDQGLLRRLMHNYAGVETQRRTMGMASMRRLGQVLDADLRAIEAAANQLAQQKPPRLIKVQRQSPMPDRDPASAAPAPAPAPAPQKATGCGWCLPWSKAGQAAAAAAVEMPGSVQHRENPMRGQRPSRVDPESVKGWGE